MHGRFSCDGGATPQRYSVRPFPRWRSARDIYGRRSVPAVVAVRSERNFFSLPSPCRPKSFLSDRVRRQTTDLLSIFYGFYDSFFSFIYNINFIAAANAVIVIVILLSSYRTRYIVVGGVLDAMDSIS